MSKHKEFVKTLSSEEKLLIVLRDELYDKSWVKMLKDLEARRSGRPYIFKLVHRIEEDIQRIETLRTYEKEYHIDLADYLEEK